MVDKINSIIKESPDIVTALESIAPMYGIPADHILESPDITSIKVVGDTIIAPTDVKPNTKSIVCAIGSVLDYISQRIDDKVSNYQMTTVDKGRIEEHIKRDANPSKGKVIARYVDPNGDEILAYDSGLVDMKNTPQARAMVVQLRNDLKIPMYNPNAMSTPKASYFTDEDDISVEEPRPEKFTESMVTDVASTICESSMIMDKIAHYHDTKHLGYEWMQEMGYDFIKPTDTFIQEAKKEKVVKPGDIKHMKFDNSHILKAIKYFNEARDEQANAAKGAWNVETFINSQGYKKGIRELEEQFDCKLNVKWFKDEDYPDENNLFTTIYDNIKQNLHISKSKGFQLNGLPIEIFVVNKAIDEEMTKSASNKLFGQFVCAGLCHEIFHNIASAVRYVNTEFTFSLNSALTLATSTPNAKNRRIVFEKFVNTLKANGIKLNPLQKKKLVKELCYISALAYNKQALTEIKGKISKSSDNLSEVDEYIRALESTNKVLKAEERRHNIIRKSPGTYGLLFGIGLLLTLTVLGAIVGIPLMMISTDPMAGYEDYLKSTNKEEFYCDLFAASYNLPLSFTYGLTKRDTAANQISKEKLNKIAMLEMNVSKLSQSKYPTLSERNYAAMTCAKNILDSGVKLDPAIKEYCEWIVANYSSILDTEISTKHQTVTFNPDEAKDLDEHIQNLITNNNIKITESYIGNYRDVIVSEMSDNTLGEEIANLSSLNDCYVRQLQLMTQSKVYQEGKIGEKVRQLNSDIKAPVLGKDGESMIKKILLFIPRVLNAIVQCIARLFNMNDIHSMMNDIDHIHKQIKKAAESGDGKIKPIAKQIVALNGSMKSGTQLDDETNKIAQDLSVKLSSYGIFRDNKSIGGYGWSGNNYNVIILAGYVPAVWGLEACKQFMMKLDEKLTALDNFVINSDNFEVFDVSDMELGDMADIGSWVYSTDDYVKYMNELTSLKSRVTKHCKELIKTYNTLNKRDVYNQFESGRTRNYDKLMVKSSQNLSSVMNKLNEVQWVYNDNLKRNRISINKLNHFMNDFSKNSHRIDAISISKQDALDILEVCCLIDEINTWE